MRARLPSALLERLNESSFAHRLQDVANSEASSVSKDDLDASKGLLHAVAGKGILTGPLLWV